MQKVIPMNPDKGVYMIVYSDNNDAEFFKKYFKNNEKNRTMLNNLLEKSLGLDGKLHIENIKDFYWKNGTHYYAPLSSNFKNRQEFISLISVRILLYITCMSNCYFVIAFCLKDSIYRYKKY